MVISLRMKYSTTTSAGSSFSVISRKRADWTFVQPQVTAKPSRRDCDTQSDWIWIFIHMMVTNL